MSNDNINMNMIKSVNAFIIEFLSQAENSSELIERFNDEKTQKELADVLSKASRVKKLKDPNAPKKLSAYILYCQDKRSEIKESNPSLKPTDVTKRLGVCWKACTPNTKGRYTTKASNIKAMYEQKMKEYKRPSDEELLGLEVNKPKGKKLKDPDAPKRPLSAFILYCQDSRDKIKEANPEMKPSDVTRELGTTWKQLSDKTKSKYQKKADKLKEEYLEAMKDYVRPSDEELKSLDVNQPKKRRTRVSKKDTDNEDTQDEEDNEEETKIKSKKSKKSKKVLEEEDTEEDEEQEIKSKKSKKSKKVLEEEDNEEETKIKSKKSKKSKKVIEEEDTEEDEEQEIKSKKSKKVLEDVKSKKSKSIEIDIPITVDSSISVVKSKKKMYTQESSLDATQVDDNDTQQSTLEDEDTVVYNDEEEINIVD